METTFTQRAELTMGLTDSLRGQIRAIKDANDSSSHIDSRSGMGGTGDGSYSSLASQGEEGSPNDSDDEKYDEKKSESDTSSRAFGNDAASISFGALVKAQASLGKRKRENDDHDCGDAQGIFGKNNAPRDFTSNEALERRAGKKDIRDFSRTSKHAPVELSSKKAVSRKREVVPIQKRNHRDPRFDPLGGAVDEEKTKKNYSFLNTYRDSEISELRSAVRETKDNEGRETLKRTLLSMESRRKAQEMKEEQQEVLRKHRKEEKERIEHGKRPFYLKKAEQKQVALITRFESMKGKQIDKVIERRRKKKAARERKGMPDARRG